MTWISPAEVVSDLNLHPDGDSPEDILRCLRKELAALHPDKTHGKFPTAADEKRWHELTTAKEYVESVARGQLAMIPLNELPALIKSMREASQEPIAVRSSRLVAESRANIRQKTFFPKLTSGVFAAICGFLVAASGSLKDHPLFGHLLSYKGTQIGLLIVMFYAAVFFFMFWMREGKAERYLEWLLTGDGTRAILSRVLRSATANENGFIFTFRQLVAEISGRRRIDRSNMRMTDPLSMIVGSRRIDQALAEKTAKIVVDRLKEEQVIQELPKRGLNQNYQISKDVANEIDESNDEA
jgi:hypothetical protein